MTVASHLTNHSKCNQPIRTRQKCSWCQTRETYNRCQTREILQPLPNAGNRQLMPSAGNHATSVKRGKTDKTKLFLFLTGWKKTCFFFSCDWRRQVVTLCRTNRRARQWQSDNKWVCFWESKQNRFFWSRLSFWTNLPMTVPLFHRKR